MFMLAGTHTYSCVLCVFVLVSLSVDSEYQTAMSQLFSSRVSSVLLGSAFQEVCHSRMCLCRDVLVMLCALEYSGSIQVSECMIVTGHYAIVT